MKSAIFCRHVVEGGFQQIEILVDIGVHWLQADEVIQKVIHLSNIEQSDKHLLHYHVLISIQKNVYNDNNKDTLKWWWSIRERELNLVRMYHFNIDIY